MNAAAKPPSIKIRRWRSSDIPAIVACQRAAYPDYPEHAQYDARIYELQLAAFPEWQYLAEHRGAVIGYATSLIVQLDDRAHRYDYDELTGSGTFSTHTPGGDTLYGADIAVDPQWRGKGVAAKLYQARRRILARYNLRRMVAYGRLTGYPEYAGRMTADEYVTAVKAGTLSDRALNAHLKAGYQVVDVKLELMRDEPSLDWATLLELENADYRPEKRRIAASPLARPVRKIRVCAAQYLMRTFDDWAAFERSVRFFVEATDEYHGHFLVLPEFFTAALLQLAPRTDDPAAMFRGLVEFAPRIDEMLRGMAREYGLYIVGGSTPAQREGELRNVATLYTPSGAAYEQEKLHVTPHERHAWGVRPGERIRVFETPLGRVGIAICYDVEFPEVVRLLALAGVEVLFVPFSTDERKSYQRVRYTAQARAIENGIYVVLAGNAGNLPQRNYLLNYARSAVLTPSDFGFPDAAVIAEADPNVETVVVADLDLAALAEYRNDGTVRPLEDRRTDLYDLRGKLPLEVISVE